MAGRQIGALYLALGITPSTVKQAASTARVAGRDIAKALEEGLLSGVGLAKLAAQISAQIEAAGNQATATARATSARIASALGDGISKNLSSPSVRSEAARAAQDVAAAYGDNFKRGVDGRLRDARGRIVSETKAAGREAADALNQALNQAGRSGGGVGGSVGFSSRLEEISRGIKAIKNEAAGLGGLFRGLTLEDQRKSADAYIARFEALKTQAIAFTRELKSAGQTGTVEFASAGRAVQQVEQRIESLQGRSRFKLLIVDALREARNEALLLSPQLSNVNNKLGLINQSLQGGGLAGGFLTGALFGFTALAQAIAGNLDKIAEFEANLKGAQLTLQASDQQIAKLADTARALGPELGILPTQIAKAFEELGSQGISAQQTLDGVGRATIILARATNENIDLAARVAAQASTVFKVSADDFERVADIIANAANQTSLRLVDFNDAIGQGSRGVALSNTQFADFAAIIATIRPAASSASDAATAFSNAVQRIYAPTQQGAAVLRQLSVSAYDASGAARPFLAVLADLEKALSNQTAQQRNSNLQILAGADGLKGLTPLLAAGADNIRALAESVSAQGTAFSQAAERTETFRGAQQRLQAAFEAFNTSPANLGVLKFVTDLTNNLADLISLAANPVNVKIKFDIGQERSFIERLLGFLDGSTTVQIAGAFADIQRANEAATQSEQNIRRIALEQAKGNIEIAAKLEVAYAKLFSSTKQGAEQARREIQALRAEADRTVAGPRPVTRAPQPPAPPRQPAPQPQQTAQVDEATNRRFVQLYRELAEARDRDTRLSADARAKRIADLTAEIDKLKSRGQTFEASARAAEQAITAENQARAEAARRSEEASRRAQTAARQLAEARAEAARRTFISDLDTRSTQELIALQDQLKTKVAQLTNNLEQRRDAEARLEAVSRLLIQRDRERASLQSTRIETAFAASVNAATDRAGLNILAARLELQRNSAKTVDDYTAANNRLEIVLRRIASLEEEAKRATLDRAQAVLKTIQNPSFSAADYGRNVITGGADAAQQFIAVQAQIRALREAVSSGVFSEAAKNAAQALRSSLESGAISQALTPIVESVISAFDEAYQSAEKRAQESAQEQAKIIAEFLDEVRVDVRLEDVRGLDDLQAQFEVGALSATALVEQLEFALEATQNLNREASRDQDWEALRTGLSRADELQQRLNDVRRSIINNLAAGLELGVIDTSEAANSLTAIIGKLEEARQTAIAEGKYALAQSIVREIENAQPLLDKLNRSLQDALSLGRELVASPIDEGARALRSAERRPTVVDGDLEKAALDAFASLPKTLNDLAAFRDLLSDTGLEGSQAFRLTEDAIVDLNIQFDQATLKIAGVRDEITKLGSERLAIVDGNFSGLLESVTRELADLRDELAAGIITNEQYEARLRTTISAYEGLLTAATDAEDRLRRALEGADAETITRAFADPARLSEDEIRKLRLEIARLKTESSNLKTQGLELIRTEFERGIVTSSEYKNAITEQIANLAKQKDEIADNSIAARLLTIEIARLKNELTTIEANRLRDIGSTFADLINVSQSLSDAINALSDETLTQIERLSRGIGGLASTAARIASLFGPIGQAIGGIIDIVRGVVEGIVNFFDTGYQRVQKNIEERSKNLRLVDPAIFQEAIRETQQDFLLFRISRFEIDEAKANLISEIASSLESGITSAFRNGLLEAFKQNDFTKFGDKFREEVGPVVFSTILDSIIKSTEFAAILQPAVTAITRAALTPDPADDLAALQLLEAAIPQVEAFANRVFAILNPIYQRFNIKQEPPSPSSPPSPPSPPSTTAPPSIGLQLPTAQGVLGVPAYVADIANAAQTLDRAAIRIESSSKTFEKSADNIAQTFNRGIRVQTFGTLTASDGRSIASDLTVYQVTG